MKVPSFTLSSNTAYTLRADALTLRDIVLFSATSHMLETSSAIAVNTLFEAEQYKEIVIGNYSGYYNRPDVGVW